MTSMLAFDKAEYQLRMKKVKARMAAEGIEVLLSTNPANMNYLAGYDGWSFYVHQLIIVTLDREEPIWVGRGQDANGAKLTTWLSPQNIIAYTDDYVHSAIKHPMDFVADILKERGYDNKVIGVEMDTYFFTAMCMERLNKFLPNATFKDATLVINWVRIVKSNQEIEFMKRAARIAEKVMQTAIDEVQVGVRECDAVAKIYQAQISGTEEFGGDYPSIVPLLPAGEKTSTPHLTWSDNRYKDGDAVILELAGCYKRYHAPLARTLVLGTPKPKVKELAEVVVEGIGAALEVVKPGALVEDIHSAWNKVIEKSGFVKDSRIGYPMGLNYPPDWGEHTASIRKGDKTVLEPNMCFHLIPGIWYDDFGVEISEPFRVTETGYETFCKFPRKLFLK